MNGKQFIKLKINYSLIEKHNIYIKSYPQNTQHLKYIYQDFIEIKITFNIWILLNVCILIFSIFDRNSIIVKISSTDYKYFATTNLINGKLQYTQMYHVRVF